MLTDVAVENLAVPAQLGEKPITISLKGVVRQDSLQREGDLQATFLLSVNVDDRGEVPVHTYTLEVSDMELTKMSWLYSTSLPVKIVS
jgi:hypothetical protein